jgi:hypothetical protein
MIIGCLPDGRYGTSSAASVARDMVRSFPNSRFALMVGIGGDAPARERDVRLGDVVVSVPQGKLGGVIQYCCEVQSPCPAVSSFAAAAAKLAIAASFYDKRINYNW